MDPVLERPFGPSSGHSWTQWPPCTSTRQKQGSGRSQSENVGAVHVPGKTRDGGRTAPNKSETSSPKEVFSLIRMRFHNHHLYEAFGILLTQCNFSHQIQRKISLPSVEAYSLVVPWDQHDQS